MVFSTVNANGPILLVQSLPMCEVLNYRKTFPGPPDLQLKNATGPPAKLASLYFGVLG